LGTNCTFDQLQHHNVYFSDDYPQEFKDIFDRRVAPRDPTIYVCATTQTDPTQAPPGHENLFVLVNTPYLSDDFIWAAHAEGYRDLVLEKLERMGLHGLRDHIVFEQMITPEDLQNRFGAQHGAIYGFSSNNRFAPFMRPQNRATDIGNLYFVGGSVHPGGGLPLVMLSGKITAELVMQDAVGVK
jgi:phytoene desaturase